MKISWIFLIVLIVNSVCYATTFVPISIKQQVMESESIVKGVVVSETYEEHPTFGVVTGVKIKADRHLGFETGVGEDIQVFYPGGKLAGQGVLIPGSPKFKAGEKVVVFLKNQHAKSWVNNLGVGKFSIKNIGTEEIIVNQIFPEHPEAGHMPLKRFYSLVEKIKKQPFKERLKDRFEVEQEKLVLHKRQARSPASFTKPKEANDKIPAYWLVIILGFLGVAISTMRNKKS